jgi:hypothetical protein
MSDSNITEFLKKVESIKGETVSISLPSKKQEIKARSLNLKQQKEIIASSADGIAGVIAFTRILNDIILDATGDSTLKIYDRAPIAVALRGNALGAKYQFSPQESIDLNKILDNYKGYKHEIKDTATVEHNGIKVALTIPTLAEENIIIKRLEEEIKRNGDNNNTKNLGSIYLYEIIKFVTTVTLEDIVIDYTSLKTQQKIEIIENLPLALNKKIINFIEELRKIERDLLTVDDVVVEIDVDFFDAE